jgi:integrase
MAKDRQQQTFTDSYIRGLKLPGIERGTTKGQPYKKSESAARGDGRLIVRVHPNGIKEFFYRYRPDGEDKTIALGRYDPTGRKGKKLADINKALREKRELQRATGDVKEHLRAEDRKRQVERRQGSMAQLLAAYVAHLRSDGKKDSASDAETIFRKHVSKPFPLVADKKANEVTGDDVRSILAKMVRAGITRQVNKARAYLGAAFSYGAEADHDPRTQARDGVLFGIKANPVSLVPVIREFERTLGRTLPEAEIREFWKGLAVLPMIQAASLRFNLALACQRPTQLLRADWPDFDFALNTMLLRDAKGRGGSRDHLVPLTPFALAQLKPLRQLNRDAPTPFTSDGKRHLAVDTLTRAVKEGSDTLA